MVKRLLFCPPPKTALNPADAAAPSPRIKHIRKRDYLYLARRSGVKVVYDYIGPADSEQAKKTMEQVQRRKRFEGLLKDIHLNLKDVKKVLRGKI